MNKLAFKDVKVLMIKIGDYLREAEDGFAPITIPGLARRLGISKENLFRVCKGTCLYCPLK